MSSGVQYYLLSTHKNTKILGTQVQWSERYFLLVFNTQNTKFWARMSSGAKGISFFQHKMDTKKSASFYLYNS